MENSSTGRRHSHDRYQTVALDDWLNLEPASLVAIHDFDADGICAAALWKLRLGGGTRALSNRQSLPQPPESARLVFLLDISCPEERFSWQLPTVVIDHHPLPESIPPETQIFHDPARCTAWLAHELLWPEDSPHGWIAVLGILSDLGDSIPSPLLQGQLERWGLNPLRQLTSLINSAHRAAGDCNLALEALMEHSSPSEMLRSEHPAVVYLKECQRKVRKRLGQAKQIPAVKRGQIALVQFESDCPVQSVVAQIWKSRLAEHVVVAANRRSDLPEVHISARSRGGLNASKVLEQIGLTVRGHAQSAGAILSPEQWEQVLKNFYAYPHQR